MANLCTDPKSFLSKLLGSLQFTFSHPLKFVLLCHFGIGCLQRGFMRSYSMTTQMIVHTTTLATMIRRTTTKIMRRIVDDSLLFVLK